MTNIPHQPSFFERQPQHIQDIVLQREPERTAREVTTHLLQFDVHATIDAVYRFRRKMGVSFGWQRKVVPASTYDLRTGQYIDALKEFNGELFGQRVLGLRGACWGRCAYRLCKAGLIQRVSNQKPAKYVQIATDDEISAWYDMEVVWGA